MQQRKDGNINIITKQAENIRANKRTQNTIEQAFNDYNEANTEHTHLSQEVENMENKIRVIHRMRETKRIPNEARTWSLPNLRSHEPYQEKSTDVTSVLETISKNYDRKLNEKG